MGSVIFYDCDSQATYGIYSKLIHAKDPKLIGTVKGRTLCLLLLSVEEDEK